MRFKFRQRTNAGRFGMGIGPDAVDQDTAQAGQLRTADIRGVGVADEDGLRRLEALRRALQGDLKDFRMGLFDPHVMRIDDDGKELRQAQAFQLLTNCAIGIGDDPQQESPRPQGFKKGGRFGANLRPESNLAKGVGDARP